MAYLFINTTRFFPASSSHKKVKITTCENFFFLRNRTTLVWKQLPFFPPAMFQRRKYTRKKTSAKKIARMYAGLPPENLENWLQTFWLHSHALLTSHVDWLHWWWTFQHFRRHSFHIFKIGTYSLQYFPRSVPHHTFFLSCFSPAKNKKCKWWWVKTYL